MKVSIWIFSGRDESPDVALRTTRFVAGYLDFTSTTMWVIYNRIRLNPLVYHHVPIKSLLKCLHQGYLNLSKMFFTSKKTFWGTKVTKAYQMPKSIPRHVKTGENCSILPQNMELRQLSRSHWASLAALGWWKGRGKPRASPYLSRRRGDAEISSSFWGYGGSNLAELWFENWHSFHWTGDSLRITEQGALQAFNDVRLHQFGDIRAISICTTNPENYTAGQLPAPFLWENSLISRITLNSLVAFSLNISRFEMRSFAHPSQDGNFNQ